MEGWPVISTEMWKSDFLLKNWFVALIAFGEPAEFYKFHESEFTWFTNCSATCVET